MNREIRSFFEDGLGHYLPHPLLWVQEVVLYHSDGVHVSKKGIDIFLRDLQQGLRELLTV